MVATLVLAIAAAAYARVGWTRMEADCGSDRNLVRHGGEVAYSWSWNPAGFRCTYGDHDVETSLWF